MTNKPIAWAWFALAVAALMLAAFVFRYEPMGRASFGNGRMVWDRWTDQACVVAYGLDRPICTPADAKGAR